MLDRSCQIDSSSGLFENLQRGSGAAPGIEASTPQSRRRDYDMRSWKTGTAAAEYCGEPARRHKKEKIIYFSFTSKKL